jgi:hypothetical protein
MKQKQVIRKSEEKKQQPRLRIELQLLSQRNNPRKTTHTTKTNSRKSKPRVSKPSISSLSKQTPPNHALHESITLTE